MKQKPKTRSKKMIIVGALLLFVIVAFATIYVLCNRDSKPQQKTEINYNAPTDEERQAGIEAKKKSIERAETSKDATDTPNSNRDYVHISKGYFDTSSNEAVIQTQLDNAVTWRSCVLVATHSGTTVTKEAPVIYQSANSLCQGFAIPKSELTAGTWKITLKAFTQEGTAHEDATEIAVP